MNESEILHIISEVFTSAPSPDVLIGIGDDAAVIAATDLSRLYASDMAVEGSHFKLDWSSPYDIGGKVAAANLADMYAMGGKALYLLVSAGIPSTLTADDIRALAQGIQDEASLVGVRVIGGDITRSERLVISIAAIGETRKAISRSGAKPGDTVVLSALTGYSSLGFELLKRGVKDARSTHHRKPKIAYSAISEMNSDNLERFTSLIDTSDGLVSDANQIASASHVHLALSKELISQLPGFSELDFMARNEHLDLWSMILHGGEDHRFLGTVHGEIPEGFFAIGRVESGEGVTVDGELVRHQGFDQFTL